MNATKTALGVAVAATALALSGCGAVCMFAPCDSFTQVTVVNDCGYDVDAWGRYAGDGPPQYPGHLVSAGTSQEIESSGSEIDVWVRRTGAEAAPNVIHWDDIAKGDMNEAGEYIVDVTGDRCPT